MKNSYETTENRNRDLPICSAVPRLPGPPRAPQTHRPPPELKICYSLKNLGHVSSKILCDNLFFLSFLIRIMRMLSNILSKFFDVQVTVHREKFL